MKNQNEVREYALAAKDWIYVWGANGQLYTKELADKLFRSYGSTTYTKGYYQDKLISGEGKMAADCSGFMHPLSGYDNTADGYYKQCIEKGTIGSLPKGKVCLVFKGNSAGRKVHIGIYLGDGTVAEMASSQSNYQLRKLGATGWTHWGIPKWIDYSVDLELKERRLGWQKSEDGRWMYFKEDGSYFCGDWAHLEWEGRKDWYYFDKEGYMMRSCVLIVKDEVFVLGPSGAMMEGFITLKTNERGALIIP